MAKPLILRRHISPKMNCQGQIHWEKKTLRQPTIKHTGIQRSLIKHYQPQKGIEERQGKKEYRF